MSKVIDLFTKEVTPSGEISDSACNIAVVDQVTTFLEKYKSSEDFNISSLVLIAKSSDHEIRTLSIVPSEEGMPMLGVLEFVVTKYKQTLTQEYEQTSESYDYE